MSEEYYKEKKKRGVALIMCNEEFDLRTAEDPDAYRLWGSPLDYERLVHTFTTLGFDVRPYMEKTAEQMLQLAKEVAGEDHSESSCVVVAITSHGWQEEQPVECAGMKFSQARQCIWGTDDIFPVHDLYDIFGEKECPSLAEKPKLFFFQACQSGINQKACSKVRIGPGGEAINSMGGDKRAGGQGKTSGPGEKEGQGDTSGPGEKAEGQGDISGPAEDSTTPEAAATSHPVTHDRGLSRDFLAFWASPPGYLAWTEPGHCSPFVEHLCDVLESDLRNSDEGDLLTLLTEVSRLVCIRYESNIPDTADEHHRFHKHGEAPYKESQLRYKISFRDK